MIQEKNKDRALLEGLIELGLGDDELSQLIQQRVEQLGLLESMGKPHLARAAHLRTVAEVVSRSRAESSIDEFLAAIETPVHMGESVLSMLIMMTEKIDSLNTKVESLSTEILRLERRLLP